MIPEQLVTQYAWLAAARCRALGVRRSSPAWADCVQEALIAIFMAAQRFDPSRGVAFDLFARRAIDGAIKEFLYRQGVVAEPVKRVSRRAARGERAHAPVTADVEELAAGVDVEGELIERLDRSRLGGWVRVELDDLPLRQRAAAWAVARGIGTCELARRVGVARETVRLWGIGAMRALAEADDPRQL